MSETILSADPRASAGVLPAVSPVPLVDFGRVAGKSPSPPPGKAEVDVQIVLGKTVLPTAAADRLDCGSIVPLDESIEAPVSLFADGRLLARGELVALDNHYALRITELVSDLPRT